MFPVTEKYSFLVYRQLQEMGHTGRIIKIPLFIIKKNKIKNEIKLTDSKFT